MLNKILLFLIIYTSVYSQSRLTEYVNPFIGTSNGGNTYPGAVVPWGMVSVSPHNAPGSPSGYIHGQKYFYGFGYNHLSGTGCADLGSIILTMADTNTTLNPETYKTTYSNETAEPGYYSLFLDKFKMKAEVTSTARTGLTKFTFASVETINIILDAGRSLNLVGGGSIKIISNTEIEGSNISGGFCGEDNRQTLYFSAKFNKPFLSAAICIGDSIITGKEYSLKDSSIRCFLKYKMTPGEQLLVKVGISYTSEDNARKNLETEIPGWDFGKVKNDADD
ncbi:MAG TPA: hypothetical protein VLB50_13725, partial [Ignavibacteriaceae bacterium]|nr:hypothetical protein [Ignavibacteriaceae bacterium]